MVELSTNDDSLKIIILSFQRNATQSTSNLFLENGFLGVHHLTNISHSDNFRDWDLEQIQDYTKTYEDDFVHFSDAPYFMMYEYFDKKYPKAKFILIERNPDDWLKSFRKLYTAMPIDPVSRVCFTKYVPGIAEILDTEIDKISDKTLLDMYNTHNSEVKEYFKDRGNLLALGLDDPDKGKKIMDFVGSKSKTVFKNSDFLIYYIENLNQELDKSNITE
jgi:hypothetical protein